jgi:transcriptional regulator with XRE-family HTH domain
MNQEKIGKLIKKLRIENKLTQKEFADKLGVTFQAVSKWENGKNIPDIAILKEISKKFNVNIDDLLEGKKTKKRINFIEISIFIILIIIILLITLLKKDNTFEFKKLKSTCDNFTITGSAAYNKTKTSIYISNIEFCGPNQSETYTNLKCTLYENHQNKIRKISNCQNEKNMTLKNYLEKIKINVDNTNKCQIFADSKLYIEINAQNSKNKITKYKIPIKLENNCN